MSRDDLAADLRALGVRPGATLLMHVSMRRIGQVADGVSALADAVLDVLGPRGTVVVPTATTDNSDTSRVHLARTKGMSDAQRRRYLAAMPAFDPARTPSTGMGIFAEHIRLSAGSSRSAHPQMSFAALGPRAEMIISEHALECHLGEKSPIARLYDVDAQVLMLGTGYDACSALHLAEYRYMGKPPMREYRCVIEQMGESQWCTYPDVVLDDTDFPKLGADLDDTPYVRRGLVGSADSRLVSVRQLVDFAVGWMAATRKR